jgi:hypothetical protein
MSGQTTQSLKISVILHTVMQRLGYNQGQNIRLHTANPNPVDFARFPPRKTAMMVTGAKLRPDWPDDNSSDDLQCRSGPESAPGQ